MIYELRTYTVFPDKMQELLNLWETIGKPVIDRHMECVLVTTSESGALNQIVHLQRWDIYQSRDESRKNFYQDPDAQAYVKQVKPMYQRQESVILSPTAFSPNITKE